MNIEYLVSVVIDYKAAVGEWWVEDSPDYLLLVWSADDKALPGDFCCDEPWKKWGGDEIIKAAEMEEPDSSGGNSYTDSSGDDIVTQWVKWNK